MFHIPYRFAKSIFARFRYCGLHVVSEALHNGVLAGSWSFEKLVHAIFKFLHNVLPEKWIF